MGTLTEYEILGSTLFFSGTLKILTHSHLASRIVEKYVIKLIFGLWK